MHTLVSIIAGNCRHCRVLEEKKWQYGERPIVRVYCRRSLRRATFAEKVPLPRHLPRRQLENQGLLHDKQLGKICDPVNHPFCLSGITEKQLRGNPASGAVMAVRVRAESRSGPGWQVHEYRVFPSAESDVTQRSLY